MNQPLIALRKQGARVVQLALIALAVPTTLGAQTAAETQEPQVGSRQIFAEEFTRSRPIKPPTTPGTSPGKASGGPTTAAARPRPRYRRVKRTRPAAGAAATTAITSTKPVELKVSTAAADIPLSAAKVGVTVWQLRAPRTSDSGARLLVQGEGELVPTRVAADAILNVGDSVFLSVESPREGYLYIVDREMFADGSVGEPYLIFPTTRTRAGDNRVAPGKLINIPDLNDRPNYFKLLPLPDRQDQNGEMLSVIITSQPLENFTPGPQPSKLTAAQVEQWERQWGGDTEEFDLEDGAGQTWSNAEREAASTGGRLLVQEAPAPQTFYLVEAKNTKGILVNVQLRYRR